MHPARVSGAGTVSGDSGRRRHHRRRARFALAGNYPVCCILARPGAAAQFTSASNRGVRDRLGSRKRLDIGGPGRVRRALA